MTADEILAIVLGAVILLLAYGALIGVYLPKGMLL